MLKKKKGFKQSTDYQRIVNTISVKQLIDESAYCFTSILSSLGPILPYEKQSQLGWMICLITFRDKTLIKSPVAPLTDKSNEKRL